MMNYPIMIHHHWNKKGGYNMNLKKLKELFSLNAIVIAMTFILYSPDFMGLNPFNLASPRLFEIAAITFWLITTFIVGNSILLRTSKNN